METDKTTGTEELKPKRREMNIARWERRYACALGMAIYIHITRDNLLMTFLGLTMCIFFATFPPFKDNSE